MSSQVEIQSLVPLFELLSTMPLSSNDAPFFWYTNSYFIRCMPHASGESSGALPSANI